MRASAFTLTFLKILAAAVTIGSGGSGGIFAPSMFIGAMAGEFFGMVAHSLWPGAAASPGAYGIVGMGAVVAATTHGPLTAILILQDVMNTGVETIYEGTPLGGGVVSCRDILGAYDKAVLKKSLFSKS